MFKKGDVVFEEGMVADGFYILKRGEFENIYKKTKTGKAFKAKTFAEHIALKKKGCGHKKPK